MSVKDLFNSLKVAVGIASGTHTSSVTNAVGVDTRGFLNAILAVNAGTVDFADTNEAYTFKIFESDTLNGTYTDTGIELPVTEAGASKLAIRELNVVTKRFIQVQLEIAGTTPSFEGGALVILGDAAKQPVE